MLDSLSSLEALEIAKQLELAITGLLAARKMLGGCRGVRTGGHFQTGPAPAEESNRELIGLVNTSAFVGTNPRDESIISD